jgi:hypothetical protein
MLLTQEIVDSIFDGREPAEGYAVVGAWFPPGTKFAVQDGYEDGVLRALPGPGHWSEDIDHDPELLVMEAEPQRLAPGMKIRLLVKP